MNLENNLCSAAELRPWRFMKENRTWQCKYISASGAALNWNDLRENCDCGATPFANISIVVSSSATPGHPDVMNS